MISSMGLSKGLLAPRVIEDPHPVEALCERARALVAPIDLTPNQSRVTLAQLGEVAEDDQASIQALVVVVAAL